MKTSKDKRRRSNMIVSSSDFKPAKQVDTRAAGNGDGIKFRPAYQEMISKDSYTRTH